MRAGCRRVPAERGDAEERCQRRAGGAAVPACPVLVARQGWMCGCGRAGQTCPEQGAWQAGRKCQRN